MPTVHRMPVAALRGFELDYARRVAVLVLCYFATAKASLALAIPPGYATAVWPPSGIALAAFAAFVAVVAGGQATHRRPRPAGPPRGGRAGARGAAARRRGGEGAAAPPRRRGATRGRPPPPGGPRGGRGGGERARRRSLHRVVAADRDGAPDVTAQLRAALGTGPRTTSPIRPTSR